MTSNNPEFSKIKPSSEDSQETKGKNSDLNNLPSATTEDIPSFGWSGYAERVNGRFAMVGFLAILIIEIFSHSGFLHWAGFVP